MAREVINWGRILAHRKASRLGLHALVIHAISASNSSRTSIIPEGESSAH
jgi:hypothetical protein